MRYIKEEERIKLEDLLHVPISDINFKSGVVQLKSGNKYIGTLPVFEAGNSLQYETNESDLKKLNWGEIYKQHKDDINSKITQELPDIDGLNVIYSTWKHVNAYDSSNQFLAGFRCSFDNGIWEVNKVKRS